MTTNKRMWVVARFPNGSWSSGGLVRDPDYELCEVYKVAASSHELAVKRGQAIRSKLKRKGDQLPTQGNPFIEKFVD